MIGAVASAQQPKKVHRIGYLSGGDAARVSARAEPIWLALRELGYMEGQNIAIEYRYGEGKRDPILRLPPSRCVSRWIASWCQAGTIDRAAMNATKTIPILLVAAGPDPVKAGLVESLARPGGNVTGITNLTGGLGGKRLELLKEAVPKVARVAVLYDPANPGTVMEAKETLPVAAGALGLTLRPWEVRAANDFAKVFAAVSK